MEKSNLQKMIELWEGIARLHTAAMFKKDVSGAHVSSEDWREQSGMRNNAVNVANAMRIYQTYLER